ncbi:MAG: tyrosine-type recombinase/integrase [Trebonia sp.]
MMLTSWPAMRMFMARVCRLCEITHKRHSAAMKLLLAGIDITVIALWLGHESLTSTQAYLHADMHQKQEAIAKTAPNGSKQKRYQPPDPLLEFLENL